jgi:O-antigen ligase
MTDWGRPALALWLCLCICSVSYRGGNSSAVIQAFAALALPATIFACYTGLVAKKQVTRTFVILCVALLTLLGAALVSIYPISAEAFLSLRGREYYSVLFQGNEAGASMTRFSVSLNPAATIISTLVIWVALVVAFCVALLDRERLHNVLGFYCAVAVAQSVLGLAQLGLGSPSFLAYGAAIGDSRAAGTFVNKNHYATFLAMALPLLLMRSAGRFTFYRITSRDTKLVRAWWGFATAIVIAALVSSVSRAGILAGLLVAVVAMLICAGDLRDRRKQIAYIGVAAVALLAAVFAGFTLLVSSLADGGFERGVEGRWLLNRMTWQGVVALFPYGAGLGSYAIAFPRFQSESFQGFAEHAHNDYLQLVFETGVIGVIVIAALALAWFLRAIELFRDRLKKGIPLANAATACALGVAAFAIHAVFDFPGHIPGVAWAVTLLATAATHATANSTIERPRKLRSSSTSASNRNNRGEAYSAG